MGLDDSVYERLLRERIIFLGTRGRRLQSPTRSAPRCCCSPPRTPTRTSTSTSTRPAARSSAGMAIYDTMQFVKNDVATVAMGLAASMGQFLLCAGTPGKRYALPHARIMMHQPSGGLGGTASDIAIQAEQMLYTKRKMAELIATHTGQSVEQIERDSDRDRWFTADEAQEYGFVDHVVPAPGRSPADGRHRMTRPLGTPTAREESDAQMSSTCTCRAPLHPAAVRGAHDATATRDPTRTTSCSRSASSSSAADRRRRRQRRHGPAAHARVR